MTYLSDRYDQKTSNVVPGGQLLRTKVSSPPSSEPFTTSDMKEYLKVEHSQDDTLIDTLIASARRHIEEQYSLALITQTIVDTFDVPLYSAELGRFPVDTLDKVEEIEDGSATTKDISGFFVDDTRPPVVRATSGIYISGKYISGAVTKNIRIRITYTAGFGSSGSDVPDDILEAIKLMVGDMYSNRTSVATTAQIDELPMTVEKLMSKWDITNA